MTELQHIQKILLEMAKDIDKVCRENKIEYYLIAGSALGAVRHHGFIPWDDDFDIAMDAKNYLKFLDVAKEKLDKSKYYIQEGYKEWSMSYTKVRLRGTILRESEIWDVSKELSGIFIDVFPLENAAKTKVGRLWQYFCGKVLISYGLKKSGTRETTFVKRLLVRLSFVLEIKKIREFFRKQVEKYRNTDTELLGSFSGNLRFKNIFFRRDDFGKPTRVPFEDTMMPIPSRYHNVLSQIYGDYMQLPPVEKQVCSHVLEIDFGKY